MAVLNFRLILNRRELFGERQYLLIKQRIYIQFDALDFSV